MIRRKVRFTATAREHIRHFKQWWQKKFDPAGDLDPRLGSIKMLALLPGIGSPYRTAPIAGVRRFYIERLMSHLYYTFDEHEVVIRALWHARRGSGPDLSSY